MGYDDQPSSGELARRLDEIRALIIGRPEYTADQRRHDDRYMGLRREVDDTSRDLEEGLKAANRRIDNMIKSGIEHRRHWRELIWQGALPAVATLIAGLLALWVAHSGGH